MEISYKKNAGLAVDADLTLLVVDTDVSVKMWSYSDPRLKWMRSYLDPRLK